MARTVNGAFEEFLKESVNLDPNDTSSARSSRDWLVKQINILPSKHADFLAMYKEVHIHYGSFARRTKIRELDDLDIIIGLKSLGATYVDSGDTVQITVPSNSAFQALCHDNSLLLNSRRVINTFVKALSDIPQYAKAELKRNGSAAVLNLSSYPWSFDIVPGFFTTPESDGRTYYVIPNGSGHWMKTDPRVDQARVPRINQANGGHVLAPLRLIKYWNRRPTMPTIPSYLLECMVLNYYEYRNDASQYPDIEVISVLSYIAGAVLSSVQDPKKIQGDINSLDWEERLAIHSRASQDARRASSARELETAGDHRGSIRKWGEIFGPAFPEYTI